MDTVTTNYTLDLNNRLTQVLSDGTDTYLYGLGRIGEYDSANWTYPLTDALGSVRQLVDASGAVVMAQNYAPYGDVLESYGAASSNYGFAGEWTDGTGLQYLRARYLNTGIGRFISRDTWGGDYNRPMSLNRWGYVEGNPVNRVDPSGMKIAEIYNTIENNSKPTYNLQISTISVNILADICAIPSPPHDVPHDFSATLLLILRNLYGVILTEGPGAQWNPQEIMNVYSGIKRLDTMINAGGKKGSFTAIFNTTPGNKLIEIVRISDSSVAGKTLRDASGNTWDYRMEFGGKVHGGVVTGPLVVHEIGHAIDYVLGAANDFEQHIKSNNFGYITNVDKYSGKANRYKIYKDGEDGKWTYWFEDPHDPGFMSPGGIFPDALSAYVYGYWREVSPGKLTKEAEFVKNYMENYFGKYTP